MRVVLDTNSVVSRYLVAAGIPAQIMTAWRLQRFDLVVSPALLAEYERVLNYERLRRRHGLSPEEVTREIAGLRDAALLVIPTEVPAVIADDPDDDHVLACAVAGEADYIVSGDRHLLTLGEYRGIRILRPAAFLALLDTNNT
jgi:putative PIN family toxin of toxin-antitoxin system